MIWKAALARKSDSVIAGIRARDGTRVRHCSTSARSPSHRLVAAVLALPSAAHADPRQVKPDRAAINALLDEFIPAVVEQKDLRPGWDLTGGVLRVTSRYRQWLPGNTSVQTYPAKGTRFHGYLVNYSYPGDVGFDILLQPTKPSLGAWSFRAEAQKLGGRWKMTTWYPVATFAPPAPGKTAQVVGPNDFGPGARGTTAARAASARGRCSRRWGCSARSRSRASASRASAGGETGRGCASSNGGSPPPGRADWRT